MHQEIARVPWTFHNGSIPCLFAVHQCRSTFWTDCKAKAEESKGRTVASLTRKRLYIMQPVEPIKERSTFGIENGILESIHRFWNVSHGISRFGRLYIDAWIIFFPYTMVRRSCLLIYSNRSVESLVFQRWSIWQSVPRGFCNFRVAFFLTLASSIVKPEIGRRLIRPSFPLPVRPGRSVFNIVHGGILSVTGSS